MELTVSGKHIEITDSIREYAAEKVAKLPRFYDRIQAIEILVDKSGNEKGVVVEIIVSVEHHDAFVGRHDSEDLYACIDEATDKLERQLRDHKEKLRNRKHR